MNGIKEQRAALYARVSTLNGQDVVRQGLRPRKHVQHIKENVRSMQRSGSSKNTGRRIRVRPGSSMPDDAGSMVPGQVSERSVVSGVLESLRELGSCRKSSTPPARLAGRHPGNKKEIGEAPPSPPASGSVSAPKEAGLPSRSEVLHDTSTRLTARREVAAWFEAAAKNAAPAKREAVVEVEATARFGAAAKLEAATKREEPTLPEEPLRWRQLEATAFHGPMSNRLLQASQRLLETEEGPKESAWCMLRQDQVAVFEDFAFYLADVATRPSDERAPPFCRIVLPPRTGKTVIAGHIVSRAGLVSTVIVPTLTLVHQTAGELAARLPDTPIGIFCGEEQNVVDYGVNVLTYAMLRSRAAAGALPDQISRSALVFVDEAHHAMTRAIMGILRREFDPEAVRVALTATPNYGDERRLEHFFPDLIHGLSLEEALGLELLAPLLVWVAEVDVDGSHVTFMAGDLEAHELGRLMSTAPFFSAVERFRYSPQNVERPALVACASRQQAKDLLGFLRAHRPAGTLEPRLILADTPGEERQESLTGFERGEVDTLIQVGVLLEGWSSPRCKLLIDLAPSLSLVRSTQKFFRVMTRHADEEARIYMLLPRELPYMPVLPMELFGTPGLEYECGELVGRRSRGRDLTQIQDSDATPVAGVALKKRILLTSRLEKPSLDPRSWADVRRVIETCPDFDPEHPCRLMRFRWLLFQHTFFKGRGDYLLRYLGLPVRREAYYTFLARAFPNVAGRFWLEEEARTETNHQWCREDVKRLTCSLLEPSSDGGPEEPYYSGWKAVVGGRLESEPNPETSAPPGARGPGTERPGHGETRAAAGYRPLFWARRQPGHDL